MQSSQQSTVSLYPNINNFILVFGFGLVLGALIGTTGIILLGLICIGYYYRDNIHIILNNLISHISSHNPKFPNINSTDVSQLNRTEWFNTLQRYVSDIMGTNKKNN